MSLPDKETPQTRVRTPVKAQSQVNPQVTSQAQPQSQRAQPQVYSLA